MTPEESAALARIEQSLLDFRRELVGNGQPGRVQRIETDVSSLKTQVRFLRGAAAGLALMGSILVAALRKALGLS